MVAWGPSLAPSKELRFHDRWGVRADPIMGVPRWGPAQSGESHERRPVGRLHAPYTQKARPVAGVTGSDDAAPRGVPVDCDRGQVIVSSRR